MHRANASWNEEFFGDETLVEAKPPRVIRGGACRGFTHEFSEECEPASTSAKLIWTGATVDVGHKTYCRGWVIYHPGNFFVVQRNSWNLLERHQKDMQTFFATPVPGNYAAGAPKAADDPHYKPDPKKLKCGQIIAVFHRNEWHRGLILQCFEDQAIYKVMMVDFGDHKNYELKMIRLLPKKFLKFPAQAIRCSLYFDGPGKALNGSRVEWTDFEAKQFRELMDPCLFYMEFVEYEVDWKLANPVIWKCRVQLLSGTHDSNRMYQVDKMFVSDTLLKRLQKCFEDQEKMKKVVPRS